PYRRHGLSGRAARTFIDRSVRRSRSGEIFIARGRALAILLEVTVNAGKGQAPGSGAPRGVQTVPRHTFRIAFDATGDWRLQAPMTPHWRSLFGEAMGKWKKDVAGTWICMDSKRQKTLLEIRRIANLKGEVFFWP